MSWRKFCRVDLQGRWRAADAGNESARKCSQEGWRVQRRRGSWIWRIGRRSQDCQGGGCARIDGKRGVTPKAEQRSIVFTRGNGIGAADKVTLLVSQLRQLVRGTMAHPHTSVWSWVSETGKLRGRMPPQPTVDVTAF